MSTTNSLPSASITSPARNDWKWIAALAVVFTCLGVTGLIATFSAGSISTVLLGILLLLGGLLQLAEARRVPSWKGVLWHLVIALLYSAAGVFVLLRPVEASGLFATMIAGVLVAIGLSRLYLARGGRGRKGNLSTLMAGIGSLLLAGLLILRWPVSGLFAVGLFVSLDLLLQSWSLLSLARAARRGTAEPALP